MLQYQESVQEVFEKHVLVALFRAEEGNSAMWQTVEKQLLSMSPAERRNLLTLLRSKGLLKAFDDSQGNFLLSLTDAGRKYVNG